jgi:hypothetical protein
MGVESHRMSVRRASPIRSSTRSGTRVVALHCHRQIRETLHGRQAAEYVPFVEPDQLLLPFERCQACLTPSVRVP